MKGGKAMQSAYLMLPTGAPTCPWPALQMLKPINGTARHKDDFTAIPWLRLPERRNAPILSWSTAVTETRHDSEWFLLSRGSLLKDWLRLRVCLAETNRVQVSRGRA